MYKNKMMNKRILFFAAVCIVVLAGIISNRNPADAQAKLPEMIVADQASAEMQINNVKELRLRSGAMADLREFGFEGSKTVGFSWRENNGLAFFAVSLDGESLAKVSAADFEIKLRFAKFDPLIGVPETPDSLSAAPSPERGAYIVQFVTQPLEEFRSELRSKGVEIFKYLPNHAYLVQMDRSSVEVVASLPFVRWVGRYEPAYKLEEPLLAGLTAGELGKDRYNIMMLRRGREMQSGLAGDIVAGGGEVHLTTDQGFRLEATLSAEQLLAAARNENVMFIDRWSPPENDMDIVRSTGGANFVESTLGFRGEGVRAEVMDNGLRQTHTDFQSGLTPIIHNSENTNEPSNHGTSTYGINFGRGTTNPQGRGLLPEAQGIFADYNFLTDRYAHTARLVQAPYNAVYQSNSWGGGVTTNYTTVSAEMDDILFLNDIVILNSQSNTGDQRSRPQAWAKNIVSVGGIRHFNTPSFDDDRWNGSASIGPAADGRIKPDLANFYDSVFTTSNSSDVGYTTGFGGTSAATPITAGHFGLFFQMWHNGLFGNPTGPTVFESRPHMTTAKAVMINTAVQWDMTIPGTDTTRVRQGFGRVNVENLYNLRNKMRIIDETDVITNLQTRRYLVGVPVGSNDPLKITLVYADPMGVPLVSPARVNDLTLRVTAPDGTVYWGNVGLGVGGGMWSTPGGSANTIDTVENVFIQSPTAGTWRVDVIASEINEDGHTETLQLDADFALVASGVVPVVPTSANVNVSGRVVGLRGNGLRGVRITLADSDGVERYAYSNTFGYFRFDEVPAGETYVVSAYSRKLSFQQSSIIINTKDNIEGLEFVAVE